MKLFGRGFKGLEWDANRESVFGTLKDVSGGFLVMSLNFSQI